MAVFARLRRAHKKIKLGSSSKINPATLQLQAKKESALRKHVSSSDSTDGFQVRKCEQPFDHNDFEWEMTLAGKEDAEPLYVVGENATGAVSLANADGAAIAELDTRWNQVCTVVQFWWDDKSYRWMMPWTAKSAEQFKLYLLQDGSSKRLASIEGPSYQQKRFWVGSLKPDSISLMCLTDDTLWLQAVIASALVAAKTQRRRDKSTPSGWRRQLQGGGF